MNANEWLPNDDNNMGLNDLQIYQLAMTLGEQVWFVVNKWDYFAKDTVGKQVVRSVDSVAANISEGFGRYHYKENINFCYIARGSLLETRTWLDKARRRSLVGDDQYNQFDKDINTLGVKLNNYLKTLGKKASDSGYKAEEPGIFYENSQMSIDWDKVFQTHNDEK
ncbi:four helix bundle protein [Spirosoma sp. KCTC 42546]|uniref:four helix bundle protein n=1 Tax=Spirosoma sp. KCTC 42546 TaxID=2520506 RepID=UPI001FEFEBE6|nr:four helix bundle protein [Spirosoma sp. KCTC 42546]